MPIQRSSKWVLQRAATHRRSEELETRLRLTARLREYSRELTANAKL